MLETPSEKPLRRRPDRSRSRAATGNSSPSVPPAMEPPSESRINRIARRAHEIYEARGGEHGKALEDWLQAEREIDAESSGDSACRE